MPKQPQQLAKLSQPRLYDALPRERLFALLDDERRHPAIWISGPPGSGKTTLVGSYLRARKQKAIWYQVDPEDNDLSTFFYFLSEARLPGKAGSKQRFPQPSAENLANPAAFARKYFREFFRQFSGPVILDNFQELVDNEGVMLALDAGIAEVPQGSNLIVISRTDPPHCLVRQMAGQQLRLIGWPQIRFNAEETRDVLGKAGGLARMADGLHARCDGWAAGVVLMKEALRREEQGIGAQTGQDNAGIFQYFASQVFERLDGESRKVVLQTALLPYFSSSWAAGLTGVAAAPEIIEGLYRRHLFLHRRDQGSYEYHALFREFLAARVEPEIAPNEIQRVRERGANLLEKSGDFDAAFGLRVAAGDWVAARRIASERAEALLAAGRWQSLTQWLNALRPQDFKADAWLEYWRGLATLATDATSARKVLERAHAGFGDAGSRTGQLQALAQILGSYFLEWHTVESMDPWIAAMESAIRDDRPVSEDALTRAHASLVVALLYRQPCHPLLHAGVRLVADRLEEERDPSQKLRMAFFLAHYYDIMGDHARARRAIDAVERLLSAHDGDPLTRVIACMRCAHHFLTRGEHERSIATADRSLDMAKDHDFPDNLVGLLEACRAHALLNAGMPLAAEKSLQRAKSLISSRHHMMVIYLYWCEFWCAALLEDQTRLRTLWTGFARIPPAGVPINTAYNMPVVYFLAEEGRFDEALTRIERWKESLAGMRSPFIEFNLDLMEAYARLRCADRDAAATSLRRAFAVGTSAGFKNTLSWMPKVMASLCAFAVEEGIEPGYVKGLVGDRGLAAPDPTLESWPWKVRVHVLGRFDVMVDGRPLAFVGRPQHRTLELLKAIVAFGGRGVSVPRVCAVLWPDAEGDAAQRAFSVALHRLRKLLDDERAVQLTDGMLSLDSQRCWVDAMAFEVLADDDTVDRRGGERLAALYQGHFLEGEEAAWALPRRQLLQSKFQHAVLRIGARLEEAKDLERAADLYRRALERDALAEEFYRRIMECRSRQGRFAEAMEAYRRCREMLSIVLGIAPSADTQALFRSIQATAAPGQSPGLQIDSLPVIRP